MRRKVKHEDSRHLNQTHPNISKFQLLQRYSVKRVLTRKNPFLLKTGFYCNIYIRVVLILGILKFLPWQGLIWFEINKKKYPPSFKSLSQFQPMPHSNASFPSKQHGVLGIERSIFYSGQSNCLKNMKLCRHYPYTIYYPSEFLQIFSYYNFGVAAR